MPRKKINLSDISLDQAFQKIESEGLEIEVKSVKKDVQPVKSNIEDFIDVPQVSTPKPIGKKFIEVDLYAAHSIGSAGSLIGDPKQANVIGNTFQTYGPGRKVRVPAEIADDILHQDLLARRADERLFSPHRRTYVVERRRSNAGVVNIGVDVTPEYGDDLSSALANMGDHRLHILR